MTPAQKRSMEVRKRAWERLKLCTCGRDLSTGLPVVNKHCIVHGDR